MIRDKLTQLAQRRAFSRIATPVIIKSKPAKLTEIVEYIRPISYEIRPTILQIRNIIPLGPIPMKILHRFEMVAAVLPREIIFDLAESPYVKKIYSDEPMYALQYPTVPKEGVYTMEHKIRKKKLTFTSTYWTKKVIGADIANKKGFTGRGIKVSVVDTGVSRTHPQVRRCEFYTTMMQYRDENGHGTWCVSCVGGARGIDYYLSGKVGREVICEGMAPECELIAVKTLGYYIGTGLTSNIIEGIQLSLEKGADIISMSLGGKCEAEKPEDDAFYDVMTEVNKEGAIAVCAAGNEGPDPNTIGTPGAIPQVLTVGAYDPVTGEMAEFSSRGPTNWNDVKPDVVAPGVNIDSAIVGMLDTAGDGMVNRYSPISGTSMATPHVSGLVALMRQAHAEVLGKLLTTCEIKEMMKQLGHEKNNDSGWGPITWQLYELWLSTEYGVEI
ncbi:MAG TPA: hypothetical protein ENF41_04430 [Candidatus Bathyarchaeota archaeon]|nr:hypothetical protein [Candidatus Bathyarchaeota archaeon]